MLIRLATRFGDFRKEEPDSFSLAPTMTIFPQFMFNLRRSQFVQASLPPALVSLEFVGVGGIEYRHQGLK